MVSFDLEISVAFGPDPQQIPLLFRQKHFGNTKL
jgi:hypothetical protein